FQHQDDAVVDDLDIVDGEQRRHPWNGGGVRGRFSYSHTRRKPKTPQSRRKPGPTGPPMKRLIGGSWLSPGMRKLIAITPADRLPLAGEFRSRRFERGFL